MKQQELFSFFPALFSFILTLVLSLVFSLRPLDYISNNACTDGEDAATSGGGTGTASNLLASSNLDPRLLHPAAQAICCKCCKQRIANPEETVK